MDNRIFSPSVMHIKKTLKVKVQKYYYFCHIKILISINFGKYILSNMRRWKLTSRILLSKNNNKLKYLI